MKRAIEIRCRLAALLEEKQVTPEELSALTDLPVGRILEYCDGEADAVSLKELGRMLTALGCDRLSDILEEGLAGEAPGDVGGTPFLMEGEWDSPCPEAPDGRHRWYKDLAVSDTVYQEFCCQACRKRLSMIL